MGSEYVKPCLDDSCESCDPNRGPDAGQCFLQDLLTGLQKGISAVLPLKIPGRSATDQGERCGPTPGPKPYYPS